ncbi:DUF3015 family protein [Deltaproteobacteria bacterium TL4]
MKNQFLMTTLLGLSLVWGGAPEKALAGCEGTYLGITQKNPIFSTLDLTMSPFYSAATTSGTSGCPNWDFVQYLEQSRYQLLISKKEQLLEESSQGTGPHLKALALMMGCRESSAQAFGEMLQLHFVRLSYYLHDSEVSPNVVSLLEQWIKEHPSLREECFTIT